MSWYEAAAQVVSNLWSDKKNRDSQQDASAANAATQKEFAQHGVRWKVEDAKQAGIHPLYALGASTISFSPSYVGSTYDGIRQSGQDISRAINATRTGSERSDANARLAALGLERAELENDLLRSQIARSNSQIGPSFPGSAVETYPVAPQADTHITRLTADSVSPGTVRITPSEQVSKSEQTPYTVAGNHAGGKNYDFGPAGKWILPSDEASQALEDLDLAKYAMIVGMNYPNLKADLMRMVTDPAKRFLSYGTPNKPAWVLRLEKSQGVPMYSRDRGKTWHFVDGR